jgi:hypothetical protein
VHSHDGFIRFLLEVAVPSRSELGAWPGVHHLQLIFCRSNFDTSFDAVGCQWASPIDVPLVEDLLLDLGVTSDEVVERFDVGLGAEDGERLISLAWCRKRRSEEMALIRGRDICASCI